MSSPAPTGMPTSGPKFAYLDECIGLTVLYYLSTILIVTAGLLCCKRRDYICKTEGSTLNHNCCGRVQEEFKYFFTGLSFESSYASYPGWFWTAVLCVYRGLCFCFFVAIPCIYQYVLEKGHNWIYFTFWNIDIISMYYLFAFSASVVGLRFRPVVSPEMSHHWTRAELFLGTLVQFFFTVAGPTALFVTVFSYTFLGATFDFSNISYHLVNTLTLLLDMLLNSMIIRWEHVTIMVSWAFLYLVYTWGMVSTGVSPTWPYGALYTDKSSSVVWYTLLFVFLLVSYFIWYLLSRLKIWLRGNWLASMLILQSPLPKLNIQTRNVIATAT